MAKELFRKSFGKSPIAIVAAPGRLELLGNHTDYNGGLVMSLAIDRYIFIAAGHRSDARIEITSSAFPGIESFYLDEIEKAPHAPWLNYTKGILIELRKRGVHFTGFNAAIHGTIPLGAGLSSSAALEIASLLAVRALFPFTIGEVSLGLPPGRDNAGKLPRLRPSEKMILAKLALQAERQFVGVNCGLLDQISSLFGREGDVMQIDCLENSVQHNPLPPGIAVVVCDSRRTHNLTEGGYNELRDYCELASKKLGVEKLRFISPAQLEAAKTQLTEREYQCAYHVVGENQRVIFGERALREGDIEQFGQYLFQSHQSSKDYFKNSTFELDALVEIARQQKGCLGARLTGGGFGGATINLVEADHVADFLPAMECAYLRVSGIQTKPWIAKVVDGAS